MSTFPSLAVPGKCPEDTCFSLVLFVVLRRRPDKTEQPICAKIGFAKVGQHSKTLKLAKVGRKIGQSRFGQSLSRPRLAKVGRKIGQNRFGQSRFGQSRSNKDGQSRSNFSGQSRFGQSRIWPKSVG